MPHSLPTNPSDNGSLRAARRPSPLAMSAVRVHDDEQQGGIEWKRVGSALNRYKWLIAFITILGTGGATVATRFIKPQYSAQATVWIDETARGGTDRGPIRQSQTFEPEAWLDLLRTYAVLDSVVHDLRLNVVFDPPLDSAAARSFAVAETFRTGQYQLRLSDDGRAYSLIEKKRGVMELGAPGDSIGRKLGFRWAPPASTFRGRSKVDFTVGTLRDAARALGEDLQAHIDPEGNFLKIELDGTDPARLTATLNDVAGRYVALAADLRHRKLGEVKGVLENQRDLAHKSLTDAEQALEAFRQRTATLPRDAAPVTSALTPGGGTGQDPVAASYFEGQKELGSVRQERATLIKYSTGYASADLMVTDLERLPSVQKSSELSAALKELGTKEADLRALRYRYSDSYPAVQKLEDDIKELRQNTIPPMVGALATQLGGREAELAGSTSKTATDLRQIPQRSTDETRLRRNVALAENLYNGLQGRFDEAHVAEASAVPDVRVLDQAVTPQRPVKNTAPRIIVIALIGSFGVAAMAAVLLDKADARFRYPNQVSETGLAILGVLPHVKSRHRGPDGLDDARLLEAVRAIRLNLTFAYGAAGPIVVTITSPGSGEGKSFLTSNLGRVFADGGRRTLVIDGDLRRGTLHRRLSISRRPGLGDYLRGETPIDQAIRHTENPNLDVITCGTRTHDAPELLGAQAMTQLLASVRAKYDVVLCDSPPLGAGVDPFVLGAATGNLLLVLRTGVSHRELTGTKLGVLSRLPIRLLGTVLNDVPDDPVFGYYSYHLPGYEAHDERAAFTGEPKVLV
jgi:polysaccharide biosynthesis transport protein